MMRKFDEVMYGEIKIGKGRVQFLDVAFLVCVILLSLWIRIALFPAVSGDYAGFLEPWMERIRELGGIRSLGYEISNYSSAYMIIMSLLSYIDASPLYLLKAVSVGFDYIAALAVGMIVYRMTGNMRRAIFGVGGVLMAPTVILNGAYWCQCDIIYSAFILWGIYFVAKGEGSKALLMTAIAFAFKLQALFIIPFLIIMCICPLQNAAAGKKGVQPADFLIMPIPYLVFTIPGILLGRDIWETIGVYFRQTDYYPWLTLNYPNLYTFFGQTYLSEYTIAELGKAGIFGTILVLGFLVYYLYGKQVRMDGGLMITVAFLSVAVILYCLPYMHERYGMLIDVIAVIYGVMKPDKVLVAIGFIMSSLISYMPFLFGKEGMPPLYHAIFQLVLIILVGIDMVRQTKSNTPRGSKNEDPVF